jgi:outer membrane receptor protein involved in Fe transport
MKDILGAGVSLMALAFAHSAAAQQSAEPAASIAGAGQTPTAPAPSDNGTRPVATARVQAPPDGADQTAKLNEVVVKAEKFGRTLQSTAASVGVVTAADIQAQAMLEVRDAYEQLPNVGIAGANNRFEIRGIPFDNVLGAGYGQLGTLYVDGVRMADKSTRFGPDLLWDVSSIDVLRGAQSTLQGRNALAGAIYINSVEPTYSWSAAGRALVSNGGGQDEAVELGGPIIDQVLALRLTAERHIMDGFVHDPVLGRDVDSANDGQYRAKLLFQPTRQLTVHAVATYSDTKRRDAPSDNREVGSNGFEVLNTTQGPGFESGVTAPGAPLTYTSYDNVLEYDSTHTFGSNITVDYKPIAGLTLTSTSSYLYVNNYNVRDGDQGNFDYTGYAGSTIPIVNPYQIGGFGAYTASGTVPVNPIDLQQEKFHTFDQEFRARYESGGWFRGLIGAFYTHEQREETNFTEYVYTGVQQLAASTAQQFKVPAATANLFGSFYSNDAPLYTFNAEPVNVENFAVYTEDEFDLTRHITLDLGLRYDQEHNDSGVITSGQVLGLANPATLSKISPSLGLLASEINAALNPFRNAQDAASMNFHALLPKASLRYKVNDDLTVGGVVQKAYRAGGVSVNVVRQLVTDLQPEYTWNYELFLRSTAFDKRLRFNANIFYTNWFNQQVAVNLSSISQDTLGVNAGHSILYGYEAQLDGDITPNITLHAGLGHSHTEFLSFKVDVPENASALGVTVSPDIDSNLRGKEFTYAPRYNGDIGGTYHLGGFFFNLNGNYQGTSYSDVANTLKDGARFLVNSRIGYHWEKATAYLFVRNLFNRTYVQDANLTNPLLGEPRVFGGAVEYKY